MVVLALKSRGNTARFFPHAGYLGLTPVIIQGVVSLGLQEDLKPVKASSVVVRVVCYESQVDGKPVKNDNVGILFEAVQELWRKGDGVEWGLLGDWESFFRIVLPISVGGVSTSSFRSYRAWWQVEAVVTHKRIAMQGTTKVVAKPLLLTRYDLPRIPPPIQFVPHTYTFHRGIECSIDHQRYILRFPSSVLKFVRPTFEELQFQTTSDRHRAINSELVSGRYVVYRSYDSTYLPQTQTQLARIAKRPNTTTFSPVYTENPSFDERGTAQTSLAVTLPKPKSAYVYSIGETMCTRFSEIYFTINVKILIKTKAGGNESIELSKELVVAPIGASERKRAGHNALRQLPACQNSQCRRFQNLKPPRN
ncbi:hypothetical protein BT69DRAFT_108089 [Atractiella rhizophila]|nr:hypothetical protein BT69DRAFT_108089 [Atractiella rhizophila]